MQKTEKKFKFAEKIFSLKNDGGEKIITLLGISFKINRNAMYDFFFGNKPVKKNKIFFYNFGGNAYGCNPKYIAEEIIKRKLPYEMVWVCKKEKIKKDCFPKEIKIVNLSNKVALREIATSKIIISNVRLQKFIKCGWHKKEEQKYIQTWHGSLGIKKIDAASKETSYINKEWQRKAQIDSKNIDFVLSNSDFEDNVFKTSFWYDGEILKTGHPRNDVFFYSEEKKNEIKSKVFSYLNLDTNKKILLYAPSFREDLSLDCYRLNVENLKSTLEEKFGGIWAVIIRMHPHVENEAKKLFNFNENIINASDYPDIQELLVASDVVITDYSSCIFDFMLSRKPAFIYAEDIEKYDNERGFYYSLYDTPFPVARNNEELVKNIENFDYEKYKSGVEEFLKDKGCMEDGHASKRVVDLIEKLIGENK